MEPCAGSEVPVKTAPEGKVKTIVHFADEKVKANYDRLKDSKTEDILEWMDHKEYERRFGY